MGNAAMNNSLPGSFMMVDPNLMVGSAGESGDMQLIPMSMANPQGTMMPPTMMMMISSSSPMIATIPSNSTMLSPLMTGNRPQAGGNTKKGGRLEQQQQHYEQYDAKQQRQPSTGSTGRPSAVPSPAKLLRSKRLRQPQPSRAPQISIVASG